MRRKVFQRQLKKSMVLSIYILISVQSAVAKESTAHIKMVIAWLEEKKLPFPVKMNR
jgi:hypothetical protein